MNSSSTTPPEHLRELIAADAAHQFFEMLGKLAGDPVDQRTMTAGHTMLALGLEVPEVALHLLHDLEAVLARARGETPEQVEANTRIYLRNIRETLEQAGLPEPTVVLGPMPCRECGDTVVVVRTSEGMMRTAPPAELGAQHICPQWRVREKEAAE